MQAYYVVQAEKALDRYDHLVTKIGERRSGRTSMRKSARSSGSGSSMAGPFRAERSAAAAAGRKPDFNRLVRAWGGVTIVYRKRLQDSPAYRLNHEEVIKSLERASVLPSG